MSWLRRKSKTPPAATAGQTEANKALGKARDSLRKVKGEEREILAAAEKLRKLGESNDFAARIERALGGAG